MSDPSALVRMAGCDWPGVAEAGRLVPATVCTVRRVSSTYQRIPGQPQGPRPVPPSRALRLFLENSLVCSVLRNAVPV